MGYWDDLPATIDVVNKKVITKVVVEGDIEADPMITFWIDKVTYQNGVEVARAGTDPLQTTMAVALLDPAFEPSATKIKNGSKALARALRTA